MALRIAATRPHLSLVADSHRILVIITAFNRRHNSNEPSTNEWMVYLHTPVIASAFLLLIAFFTPAGAAALARQLVEDLYVSD